MIEALDHIDVLVDDAPAAVAGYAAMLGHSASGQHLQLANMALDIAANTRRTTTAEVRHRRRSDLCSPFAT